MEPSDITVEILKDIRDEIRGVRTELGGRIEQTHARLDETNERLERVEQRQVASEMHLATELVAVKDAVDRVADLFAKDRGVRAQVTDHEKRITSLEKRPRR
jgi:hypothetical protein